jgi:hypothetical protein
MEFTMSIKTKFAALALAAVTATGSIVATTPAHAGGGGFNPGWAIGAGIVGAAVVGSAIAGSQPYPYYYHRCGFVRQFDAWGNYIGTVRTCY